MSNTLLGGAIGDALGVFAETKLINYQPLLDWDGKTFIGSEHHNLLPGQFSDDTQLSIEVAESLINNNGFNPDDLAKRYSEWMSSGRARGWGRTTLAAIQNLDNGVHWSASGIAGSYGNGTAMRAAPFGVWYRDDIKSLIESVKIDSAITHASEEAEAGALSIALAAAFAANNDIDNLLNRICEHLPDSKVKKTVYSLGSLIDAEHINPASALSVLGTKADVRQTVPAALYCFLRFDNYHEGVEAAIRAGGDTDTTAAIVGALFGAQLGMKGIEPMFYTVEEFGRLVELDSRLYSRYSQSFFPRG
jgi:ADP-ribosyl-[dinitrogen reductase] hydrolase